MSDTGWGWIAITAVVFLVTGCDRPPKQNSVAGIEKTTPATERKVVLEAPAVVAQDRLEWNMATLVVPYDKIGRKNELWDADARTALTLFAKVRSKKATVEESRQVNEFAGKAKAAGCDDPLVDYLAVRAQWGHSTQTGEQGARAYAQVAARMNESEYPPIRKFYCSLRAAEALKANATNTPPDVHELRRVSTVHLGEVLREASMPVEEVYDAAHDLLEATQNNKAARE